MSPGGLYHKSYYGRDSLTKKASVFVKASKVTNYSKCTSLLHYGINYGPKTGLFIQVPDTSPIKLFTAVIYGFS
jgi:hypothetical protein